MTRTITANI